MNDFMQGYDEVPEDHGMVRESLTPGKKYLLRIKVTDKEKWARPYGEEDPIDPYVVPRVRMALIALDPDTDQPTGETGFYNWKLGADTHYYEGEHPNGVWLPMPEETIRDEKGRIKQRSHADEKAKQWGKTKGFLKAIEVTTQASDDVFEFFNADAWNDKVFVGQWGKVGPRDGEGAEFLQNWFHVDDEKHGRANLPREKKAVKAAAVVGSL